MQEPNFTDKEISRMEEENRVYWDTKQADIDKGERELRKIREGTGLTALTRPVKPNEVDPNNTEEFEVSTDYWNAFITMPYEFEGRSTITAEAWANANCGPNKHKYQHIHWYADQILQLHDLCVDTITGTEQSEITQHSAKYQIFENAFQIGALFREALWKQQHEAAAEYGYKSKEQSRLRSSRGGDGTKAVKEQRIQVFNQIALANIKDWICLTPPQQIGLLVKLADAYEPDKSQNIFYHKKSGIILSSDWFDRQLSTLRSTGQIKRALEKA